MLIASWLMMKMVS